MKCKCEYMNEYLLQIHGGFHNKSLILVKDRPMEQKRELKETQVKNVPLTRKGQAV